MPLIEKQLDEAHKHCVENKEAVLASKLCGCFYCLTTFKPEEVTEWARESRKGPAEGTTAICPYCKIDSVLADKSGFPLDENFLRRMKLYWFGPSF